VDPTGLEPATSSVSRKRSSQAELRVRESPTLPAPEPPTSDRSRPANGGVTAGTCHTPAMDYRQLMRFLAAGRVVIGVAMVLLPSRVARVWAGPDAGAGAVTQITRALGVRDLVLGAGTLRALESGEPARTWVSAGAVSDAVDAAAAGLAGRHTGGRRATFTVVVASGAAALGAVAAGRVD